MPTMVQQATDPSMGLVEVLISSRSCHPIQFSQHMWHLRGLPHLCPLPVE